MISILLNKWTNKRNDIWAESLQVTINSVDGVEQVILSKWESMCSVLEAWARMVYLSSNQ